MITAPFSEINVGNEGIYLANMSTAYQQLPDDKIVGNPASFNLRIAFIAATLSTRRSSVRVPSISQKIALTSAFLIRFLKEFESFLFVVEDKW